MAKPRGNGPMILSRSANFYTRRTEEQLLREEPDHSAFTKDQVAFIKKELGRWGNSKLADPPKPVAIAAQDAPEGLNGFFYAYQVKAEGGYPNLHFEVIPDAAAAEVAREDGDEIAALVAETGGLPLGLHLLPDGTLKGEAAQAGNFTVHVKVTDALGNTATGEFPIVIKEAPEEAEPVEEAEAATAEGSGAVAHTETGGVDKDEPLP